MAKAGRKVRQYSAAMMAIVAIGCAEVKDPASETPVDLSVGLYEIGVTSAVGPVSSKDDETTTHCVKNHETRSFPYLLAEKYLAFHGACGAERSPRQGNAFGGELTCLADQKMAAGANRFVYHGAIATDRVELEGRFKLDAELKPGAAGADVTDAQLKLAMKAFERVKSVIVAKRIGDCS